MAFNRRLNTPLTLKNSFFLWGPRQAGKTYYLNNRYPNAFRIDLLNSSQFIKYSSNPNLLEEELRLIDKDTLIIIDEVQKVPLLLDEVHRLIEDQNWCFGMCGSSARKLKRGHANLLGGRALRYEMFGLTINELDLDFDLIKFANTGNLPSHYLADNYWDLLESYVSDYLKEEIFAEALARDIPSFHNFLKAAALCDTELVDYTNIASDCGVKSATVKNYYEIMCDTLQGFFLPAYTKRAKRKIKHSPKFFFANAGVVNYLAKRKGIEPGSAIFGKAFENIIANEVRAWNSYNKFNHELSYWQLDSDYEVDLLIDELDVAIEIKAVSDISSKHLKGLRELQKEHPKFNSRILVSLEARSRITEDGIIIYSLQDFIENLWTKNLIRNKKT